ncbi:DUF4127 family protein [Streptomyces sp. MAR4 CNY-716]
MNGTTSAATGPAGHGERIALVPLDERPACVTLPALVAAVAGVEVDTPPAALLPRLRSPGDPRGLGRWLEDTARSAAAAVVSLETLGYGSLIASRTVPAAVADVVARWTPLRTLTAAGVPVHAVCLVTRTPDSADAMEEPEYWDPYGPALHRLSAALHRDGNDPAADSLPADVRADFLTRRLRNHTLNLAALELAATGGVRTLVVGADDTAPHAMATAELGWLEKWAGWLRLDGAVSVRPGADEACTTLVARTVGELTGGPPPRVVVECAEPGGLDRIAPYENVTVARTAARQVQACGGTVVAPGEPCDLHLLVHPPDGSGADWAVAPPADRPAPAGDRAAHLAAYAHRLVQDGEAVAVADCAQPNGADPLLVKALAEAGIADRLAGFAGWNTAGNTLGTVAAHALTALAARRAGRFDAAAHHRLLLHRYLEDWGYMTRIRTAARAALGSNPTRHDSVPDDHPVLAAIEKGLAACRTELGGFDGLDVVPGSVKLPWRRTFEADFEIAATASAPRSDDDREAAC